MRWRAADDEFHLTLILLMLIAIYYILAAGKEACAPHAILQFTAYTLSRAYIANKAADIDFAFIYFTMIYNALLCSRRAMMIFPLVDDVTPPRYSAAYAFCVTARRQTSHASLAHGAHLILLFSAFRIISAASNLPTRRPLSCGFGAI